MKKHIVLGATAGISLLLVYSGTLVLLQGSEYFLQQTSRLWYWILVLDAGFGVQIGLFSFLRQGLRARRKAVNASAAVSGGISAGSMVACCGHHLTEVLPLVGLPGLTAFLADYQVFFMIIGILANMIGITMMLETIQRLELCPKIARLRWKMGSIKKVAMASSAIIAPVAFLIIR